VIVGGKPVALPHGAGESPLKRIKTVRDLKAEAYKSLKEAIVSRRLPPGSQLKESDLVEKLGVSRTPIREALNQLSKDGIVEIYPRKGAFVKNCSKEEVVEILILREVMEGLAARLATNHLSEESIRKLECFFAQYKDGSIDYAQADELFHSMIIQACGSTRLVGLINNLKDSLQMLDMRAVSFRFPERITESLAEHMEIIVAFRKRNEILAETLTRKNFQQSRFHYEGHLEPR
jgi:DNA-binding GntR family transcriptional regulator